MTQHTRALGAEIDGRLTALELLATVLLSQRPDHEKVLSNVEALIASLETQLLQQQPEDREHIAQMFEAARTTIDGIGTQLRFAAGMKT